MKMKKSNPLIVLLLSLCSVVFSQNNAYQEEADRLFQAGEYEKAIPVLSECLTLYPDSFPIQKMLANCFFNAGCIDSAYVLYKKIADCHTGDYDTFVFLGNYCYVAGNKHVKRVLNEKNLPKREGRRSRRETSAEYYNTAAEYLEKAYAIYNSEEIRKTLLNIYTITGKKDKILLHRKPTKKITETRGVNTPFIYLYL
jgi:tetratricopeptide (TPR) repeat protein